MLVSTYTLRAMLVPEFKILYFVDCCLVVLEADVYNLTKLI